MKGGNRRVPDPKSERSDLRGVRFGKLPRGGYTGRRPAWPLTKATARERQIWNELWRTPQAAAWATEPWRHWAVAFYVRLSARAEEPDAPASLMTPLLRFAEQIGMTPGGLRLNMWQIQEAPNTRVAEAVENPPQRPPTVPPGHVPAKERIARMGPDGVLILPRDRMRTTRPMGPNREGIDHG